MLVRGNYYEGPSGACTVVKERRKRGEYWTACQRENGALRRFYLGKSEALTAQRLTEAAEALR